MLANLDKLKIMLTKISRLFSVIGISETWLNDHTSDQVDIPGYNFISNHRTSKIGGGIGLYLLDHFQYKLLSDCNISDPDTLESPFVEIHNPHGKNIIVGTVYRPPNSNLLEFQEKFNRIISLISKNNKHCYVMGDFNLDLLHYDHHGPTQEYMDSLFSHTFLPLITKPTRLTANSATLIDNIFTNYPTQNIFSGIILNDISDHLPIFAYVNSDSVPNKIQEKTFIRDLSVANLIKFQNSLSSINWSHVLSSNDPIDSYDTFLLEYTRKYEDCFPLKPVQNSKLKIPFTPWITKGILTSARKKNRLYKKFMKSHNPIHEAQ